MDNLKERFFMGQHPEFDCDFTGLSDEQKKAIETLIDNCQEKFFLGIYPPTACDRFRHANALMASSDPVTRKRGKAYNKALLDLYTQKP